MGKIISRKPEIKKHTDACLDVYREQGVSAFIKTFNTQVLQNKVKFPMLEYSGKLLCESIPPEEQLEICDRIERLKTIGGNVIIGIILQLRLKDYFEQSLEKATEYISQADAWYVCDIIGERVFGFALLHHSLETIPEIKKRSGHSSNWLLRSLGAGIHYAIKKGLDKKSVKTLFRILLSKANTKDKEIRQGIGWAAKTTAKFHPDIIAHFAATINDDDIVDNWFRRKIDIGLKRNQLYN